MPEVDGWFGDPTDGRLGASAATTESEYPATIPLEVVVVPSNEGTVVLRLVGEIDVLTAPVLAGHIDRHFAQRAEDAHRRLVVDLSGVTFLASAGLAVLANAANLAAQRNIEVRLVAATRVVLRPLSLTGLDRALRIVSDLASAVAED